MMHNTPLRIAVSIGVRIGAVWWANRDSNPGPSGYEPDALTN